MAVDRTPHYARPALVVALLTALLAALALVPSTASAQRAAQCPGGTEPLRWEDQQTTMVCRGGVRISLARSVEQRAARSRCENGRQPLRWEDNATTMICPGGERIEFAEASSRVALANTGLSLPLLALLGLGFVLVGGALYGTTRRERGATP